MRYEDLLDQVLELTYRVAEAERRVRNVMRYVEVTEVDPAKGVAKVIDRGGGEGKDLPSDWLPWMELGAPRGGGNGTTWRPPTKGQRAIWFSPSGNLAEGILINGGFSNAAGQPSQSGDEHVETIGQTRVTYRPGQTIIKSPRVDINPSS